MVRSALVPQVIVRTGLTPVLTAANVDGHSIPADGMTYVEVRNAAGAPINVTVETPIVQDGLALADLVVAIPATTGVKRIGPFPNSIYKQADGTVNINFSAVASVTCGAFKVPRA